MKRFITILTMGILLLQLVCGCSIEDPDGDNYIYYYKGDIYTLRDPFGNYIDNQWHFPIKNHSDTSHVKIYFGPESNEDKTPNTGAKKFNDPILNMILVKWDDLLCKEGYLPDYRDVESVEMIYFVRPNKHFEIDFFGNDARVLSHPKKVQEFFDAIKAASLNTKWNNNSSPEQVSATDYSEIHIGLQFFGVLALYDVGYINMTESGKYGLYLYDVQPNELFLLDDNTLHLLIESSSIDTTQSPE